MKNVLLILRHTKKQLNNDVKYNGIINAFRRKGYCVWYTYSEGKCIYIDNGEVQNKIGKLSLKTKNISRNTSLYKAVSDFIKKSDIEFKYCYIRSMPALLGYVKMLKSINRKGIRIAIEIPTYPSKEEQKTEKFFRSILMKILRKNEEKSLQYVDVYLPMGEYVDEIDGVPAVNIENGIDTDIIKKREYKKCGSENEIHMLAVAKIARWHGYDRVIEGMKLYYEKKPDVKVYFHLVGPDGDGSLKQYIKKIDDYKLGEYILLEGPKYGDEANEYFNMADIAIASINIQGLKVVYPLKIVEYMARGIPFVYAESQCQVRPDWDFCMSVKTDGTPIDIDKLVSFTRKVNSSENVADRMREIAVRDCSWDEQINRIIDYFENRKRL